MAEFTINYILTLMSTNPKTIKSYNSYANTWVNKMRSGQNIAHTYLEKPAMYAKLPNIKGKRVLCLGCGTGEECEYLASRGALVMGIDASKELIKIAKKSFPSIDFKVMNIEYLRFPKKTFDFVYSSLTMHYIQNWTPVLRKINIILKDDGIFLFSTHHPVKWGSETKRAADKNMFLLGYAKYKNKDLCIVYGDYLNERKIHDIWFNEFRVSYYHKPLSKIISEILSAKFEIIDFLEPKPTLNAKKVKRNFWNIHQKIPLFMIFELKKK